MPNRQEEFTEFYRQLALLLRAQLPLPESVRSLAASCRDRRVRAVLDQVADDVGNGLPLADALRRHAREFPAFHLRLVGAAEQAGTLPHVLFAVQSDAPGRLCAFGGSFNDAARLDGIADDKMPNLFSGQHGFQLLQRLPGSDPHGDNHLLDRF